VHDWTCGADQMSSSVQQSAQRNDDIHQYMLSLRLAYVVVSPSSLVSPFFCFIPFICYLIFHHETSITMNDSSLLAAHAKKIKAAKIVNSLPLIFEDASISDVILE
jgi:hypothetical protein